MTTKRLLMFRLQMFIMKFFYNSIYPLVVLNFAKTLIYKLMRLKILLNFSFHEIILTFIIFFK